MQNHLWQRHFERNETRPDLLVPPTPIDLPEEMKDPVIASLRTFQAGETGEGRVVAQARAAMGAAEPAFAEAMRLYIAEEGRHARELGLLLRALGARRAASVPAASVFRVARGVIGFRTKMAILTAAEVVGIVYYDLLAERVPSPALRRVVRVIVAEERAHVVFQRDFFASQVDGIGGGRSVGRLARGALGLALSAAVTAALAVFVADERALLRALGVSPLDVARRAHAVSREALTAEPADVVRAVELVHRRARAEQRDVPSKWMDR